jgi:hypothetical protein
LPVPSARNVSPVKAAPNNKVPGYTGFVQGQRDCFANTYGSTTEALKHTETKGVNINTGKSFFLRFEVPQAGYTRQKHEPPTGCKPIPRTGSNRARKAPMQSVMSPITSDFTSLKRKQAANRATTAPEPVRQDMVLQRAVDVQPRTKEPNFPFYGTVNGIFYLLPHHTTQRTHSNAISFRTGKSHTFKKGQEIIPQQLSASRSKIPGASLVSLTLCVALN